jgi:hypothetical protein
MTQAAQLAQYGANNVGLSFKNRIINGDMTIDQRNNGASVGTGSGTSVYTLDRWQVYYSQVNKFTVQRNAGSVTPPAGFSNYLGVTSSSAYTVGSGEEFSVNQFPEGFNWADLNWGTANASAVTLSFWVRSSLTGTFGGAIRNYAGSRSYPFTYTISAANTWEYKTVTIPGDTSGTWVGATNAGAAIIGLGLGVGASASGTAGAWASANFASATGAVSVVGTNGATFYITGVQLEKGTVATSFDYLPYTTELQLCQRYYNRVDFNTFASGFSDTSTGFRCTFAYPVQMRSAPTLVTSGTAGDYAIRQAGVVSVVCNSVPSIVGAATSTTRIDVSVASGLTTGYGGFLGASGSSAPLSFNAEL